MQLISSDPSKELSPTDNRLAFPWGRVSEALKDEKILQDLLTDAPYDHAPIF